MSYKLSTYIFSTNDPDPLRADLNSYWINQEFALNLLGESPDLRPEYSQATLKSSGDNFYKKRQTIKVSKQPAFDMTNQGQSTASLTTVFQNYVKSNFVPYFDSHSSASTATRETVFDTQSPIVTKDFSNTSDPMVGINQVKEEFIINFLEKSFEDSIAPSSISELSLPNFYDVIKVNGDPPQDSYFDDFAKNIPPPDVRYENIMISMDNYKEMERINGFDKVFPLEVKLSPYNSAISRPSAFHEALDDSNLDLTLIDLMSRAGNNIDPTILSSSNYDMYQLEFLDSGQINYSGSAMNLESLNLMTWARNISPTIEALTTEFETANKIYIGPTNKSINIAKGDAGALKEIMSSAMFLGKIKDLIRDKLKSFGEINRGDKSYSEIVFYKVEKYTSPDAPTPIQNIWIPNINQIDPIEYVDTQVKYNKEYTYKVHAYSAVIGTKYYYDTNTFQSSFISPDLFSGPIAGNDKLEATVSQRNAQLSVTAPATSGLLSNSLSLGDPTDLKKKKAGSSTFDPSLGLPNTIGPNIQTNLAGQTPGAEYFQIDVITEPTVELVKTELFMFSGFILDDPPMIPDVKFTSYIGVDNRITISMSSQIGEYKDKPITLNEEDFDFINSLRLARGLPSDSLITYKTDDETAAFEIYRMDTVPITYGDFSDKMLRTISTLQRSSFSTIYSSNVCNLEKIVPNKDYYYMVRSVDIHNHKSYPSKVYKVKVVNDSGAIYPLVEVIDMKPQEKPRMKAMNFKKFLQLTPSFSQISLNYESSNLVTDSGRTANSALGKESQITLGNANPRLFGNSSNGQTFKIRLISKNTGKKIDLNVTFKVENEL
jgi:hypothetical protein